MEDSKKPAWQPRTRMVRAGTKRSAFLETSEAIFMNSGYVYPSAEAAAEAFVAEGPGRFVYSRYGNPTVAMFEERMAAVEGAKHCRALASGMSSVWNALLACTRHGSRVVGSNALFGSCEHILNNLLPRYGIETQLVEGDDLDQWKDALSRPADAVFVESVANPTLQLVDVEAIATLAHAAGARLIVDNVFPTPMLLKPLDLGADIVVYSATKHIDGQGRTLSGAILGNDGEWFEKELTPFLRHTGPSMSPFNAWVVLKGLETLDLRVDLHCTNARAIAAFLAGEPRVKRVIYPGLPSHPQHALALKQMGGRGGPMITFELADQADAFRLLNGLEIIDISNNLGDAKSLITHPATTTHQRLGPEGRKRMGITDGMLRLSVGLEDVTDLVQDLGNALKC